MNIFTVTFVAVALFAILPAVTSDVCVSNATLALTAQATLNANNIAKATLTEQATALAQAAKIAALRLSIATTAQAVAAQASVLLIGLQAAEDARVVLVQSQAVDNALAAAKYTVSLNTAFVACAEIAALPAGQVNNSCAYNATKALATEISSYAKYVTTASNVEKNTAAAAAASIAATGILIQKNAETVLIANAAIVIKNESPANMTIRLILQASRAAAIAAQGQVLLTGLEAAETYRQLIVTNRATADSISEAIYFVALNEAVVACAAISALTPQVKGSCAYNATLKIAAQISSNAKNVTAAAIIERNKARVGAAAIAAAGALIVKNVQTTLAANTVTVNKNIPILSPAALTALLNTQASTAAAVAIISANKMTAITATEVNRATVAAALAATNAIKAAVALVALNAELAACG